MRMALTKVAIHSRMLDVIVIISNSVSLCYEDSVDHILDLFLKSTDVIQQIVRIPPETLGHLTEARRTYQH